MDDIIFYKEINPKNPVVIAGWPGMGSVALGVADYLRKKLGAVRFAEIKIDPLAALDSVEVRNGEATVPPPPKNTFYYVKNPELIIFEGQVQLAGASGIKLLNKVLDLCVRFKAAGIYTGAAFPAPISYSEPPQVYGAANKRGMINSLSRFDVKPMEGGHISGLNGLIIGFAKARNIEAICLLATMPQYAISLPNPKASAAIIEVLRSILNFNIDMKELDEYIKDTDERMALIEDKVKDVLTIEAKEVELPPIDKKVPAYIMEKIEKLFLDAKKDKTKAIHLKKELDRWDLYNIYEDRFLSLFKDNQ